LIGYSGIITPSFYIKIPKKQGQWRQPLIVSPRACQKNKNDDKLSIAFILMFYPHFTHTFPPFFHRENRLPFWVFCFIKV